MSRITRFSGRDPGPAARMSGFLTHLRENGLRLGVGETELALAGLTCIKAARVTETRSALKAICSGCKEDIERFDDLFAAYWMNDGRVRTQNHNLSSAEFIYRGVHLEQDRQRSKRQSWNTRSASKLRGRG